MSYDLMILGIAVADGLLAQRKLDGPQSRCIPARSLGAGQTHPKKWR